jgi:hypothetical protein
MRVTATGAENGGLGPFFGVQAYDDHSGTIGLLGSLGVDATTMDVVYQREQDGIIAETGVKATSDVWYSFAILFDFDASEFTIYFEGRALRTDEFVDLDLEGVTLDRITDADFAALASQAEEESQQMEGTAYVDNFRIAVGTINELLPADANRDGVVDGLDFGFWQANFGTDYSGPTSNTSTQQSLSGTIAAATPAQSVDLGLDGGLPSQPAPLKLGALVAIAQLSAGGNEDGPSDPTAIATRRPQINVSLSSQARDVVLGAWNINPYGAGDSDALTANAVEHNQDDGRHRPGDYTEGELETLWAAFSA